MLGAHDDDTSGAAGMDLLATLFIIFTVLAASLAVSAQGPTVPVGKRYLIVGLKVENAVTEQRLNVGLTLRNEDTGVDNNVYSSSSRLTSFYQLRTTEPVGMIAVFSPIDPGDYRLSVLDEAHPSWNEHFGQGSSAQLCLYAQFPLQTRVHQECFTEPKGDIYFSVKFDQ